MQSLKDHLEQSPATDNQDMSNTAFAAVANGTEARFFVTWREETDVYKMQHIRSYCLAEPDHYILFQRAVRNVLSWGYGERLESIRASLVSLTSNSCSIPREKRKGDSLGSEDEQRKRRGI